MQMICENAGNRACIENQCPFVVPHKLANGYKPTCMAYKPIEYKEEPKMRLNTVDEQCALIRAEAEGKWIEYETFDGIWCGKLTEKGGWSFNTLCYRVKPEPAAPVVEEYPIEMSGGEYFYIKDGQRCRIHLAAQRGFVFVHEDGNYYGQAIMWRGKDGMLFADGGPNCKPAIAKAVRRVLK